MKITTRFKMNNIELKPLDFLFIFFCFFPFIIPNPIVTTNIQPYAAVLGFFVILVELYRRKFIVKLSSPLFFVATLFTLLVSVVILFIAEVTMSSFRALFNYFSVAFIPFGLYLVFQRLGILPEKLFKALILVWFFVAAFQFFVNRSFLTSIIGGVRFSYSYRGVVGLSSEPSFLGIACFYFLHLVARFEKNKGLFFILVLVMGIAFAQSMMGMLFLGAFVIVYLLDVANTKKGIYIWISVVIAVVCFAVLLNTVLSGSRLNQLLTIFIEDGMKGLLEDASAETRYEAFFGSIGDAIANNLIPMGYTRRIGSGYGGFLCELGFLAIPVLVGISFAMACTFQKTYTRVLYFFVFTALLFNNTQVGNPLLLVVVAVNLISLYMERNKSMSRKETAL